ncbi:MAG: hypothetical protein RIC29_01905 [Rhodospirillaceae bacterium]
MKRQTLQIGSALLATTALSTASYAATIKADAAVGAIPGTFNTPKVAAQIFGGATPATITVGDQQFAIDFAAPGGLTSTFDVNLDLTGADFNAFTQSLGVFAESTGGSLTAVSFTGCSVQLLTDRIIVDTCLASSTTPRVDVLILSGITYDEANGLATAGANISISGIALGTTSRTTFETITSTNLVTSVNALSGSVTAGGTLNISNTATPTAFSKLTGAATTGSLATVNSTLNPSVTNAALGSPTVFATTVSTLSSTVELTVTHGVLTDAATTKLQISEIGVATATMASFTPTTTAGSVASFNITTEARLTGSFDVEVQFNGSTAISEWAAGTVAIAFTSGSATEAASPGASGATAALSRSGFTTELNTVQSTFGDGGTLFQSFVRITNNGAVPGTATIVVKNDNTGATIGTYTTESIEAKSSLQISMQQIEAVVGAPASNIQYRLEFSGAIDGYVQHVMFNSVDNYFTELSGARAANP